MLNCGSAISEYNISEEPNDRLMLLNDFLQRSYDRDLRILSSALQTRVSLSTNNAGCLFGRLRARSKNKDSSPMKTKTQCSSSKLGRVILSDNESDETPHRMLIHPVDTKRKYVTHQS